MLVGSQRVRHSLDLRLGRFHAKGNADSCTTTGAVLTLLEAQQRHEDFARQCHQMRLYSCTSVFVTITFFDRSIWRWRLGRYSEEKILE